MPSPDASPYVDLRLFDKDSQDIFESALINLQSYLPAWTPREGQTEVLLLESLALEVSEGVFAINRLPGAVMEVLMRLYGVTRDLGTPPTATLTFTVSDSNEHLLPAGTRAALALPNGEDPIVFTTTAPLLIAAGSTTGTVAAVGDRNTDAGNGTAAGTLLDLLDAVVYVERVQLGSTVGGGASEEDDAAWFDRGVGRFSRLVETLVLPRHFKAAALERPEVERAYAIDNYDPAVGPAPAAGASGVNAGHVTVAVYGNGAALTTAQRDAIAVDFDAQAQANLAVHIVDPTITDVTVTSTVLAVAGYTVAQVQANVAAALAAYMSPMTWEWSGTVYRNELIALIDGVEGVQRVISIAAPAADLTIGGVAPLARFNPASVTTVTLP